MPPEPAVITAIREFKQGLLLREQGQMQEMARRWFQIEQHLDGEMAALLNQVELLRANGEEPSRSKLLQMERYKRLLAQARDELQSYGTYAERLIAENQRAYATTALNESKIATQLALQFGGQVNTYFDVLNVDAIETMVGLAGDGSPLNKLLRESWPAAASSMTDKLIQGVALGKNPQVTARMMREGLADGLNRTLTIARTEQLRAYREASRMQYQRSGVISHYKRLSAKDSRTCMACLMADGRVYDLETSFEDHPNGRCTLVPVVKGLKEIKWETGAQWFRAQPPSVQKEAMGGDYFKAWKAGQFKLEQLVTVHQHPTWGGSVQVTPLKNLV